MSPRHLRRFRFRLRAVILGAALSAGCTAPLVLAEDPDIDGPLVPAPPADSADPDGGSGDEPQISQVEGGARDAAKEDSPFVGPNNDLDAGDKPMPSDKKDAGGD